MAEIQKEILLILLGASFSAVVGIVVYIFKRKVEQTRTQEVLEETSKLLDIHQKMLNQKVLPEQLSRLKHLLLKEASSKNISNRSATNNMALDTLVLLLANETSQLWLSIKASEALRDLSSDSVFASNRYLEHLWKSYNFAMQWLKDVNEIEGFSERLEKRVGVDLNKQIQLLELAEKTEHLHHQVDHLFNQAESLFRS